ncbi:hypothetical protein D3C85_1587480 [compost metagenome]
MLLLPRLIGGYTGVMVEKFGYHDFFIITALLGIPTLVLILVHWYQESRREGPTPTQTPEPTQTTNAIE